MIHSNLVCVCECVCESETAESQFTSQCKANCNTRLFMDGKAFNIYFHSLSLPNVGEFYAECLNEELPKWHHRCMGVVRIVEIIHFTAAQLPCKVPRMDGCLHLAKRPPNMAISAVFQWHRYGIDGAPFWKHKHMKSYEII